MIAKFREIADPRLGAGRAEAIVTQALMLDALPSARAFLAQAALGLGGGQA